MKDKHWHRQVIPVFDYKQQEMWVEYLFTLNISPMDREKNINACVICLTPINSMHE